MKSISFRAMHSSERKKRLNKDGNGVVWIYAYQCSESGKPQQKYFPTGIYVSPDQWDKKSRQVKDHPNALAYNSLINRKMSELMEYQVGMVNERHGAHVPLREFHEQFTATGGQKLSFTAFYKMTAQQRKEISSATRQTQLNTLNHWRTAVGEVSFNELDYQVLDAFNQYLLGEEKELTTIDKYHRHVKTYINIAINKGYVKSGINPYSKFKYDKGSTKPRDFLRLEELKLLEEMDTSRITKKQERARDFFLVMAFTGLRFSDAVVMKPKNITKMRKGYYYSAIMVKNKRRKKKEINLPLYAFFYFKDEEESRAQRWMKICLEKYGKNPNKALFEGLTNQDANENIKKVAEVAGVDKHLTCHVGRHSFGTNMAVKVPIPTLQSYMGHDDIETTMHYVQMSKKIQDEVIERIRWEN
jgi:site-specific recombinase XerD